MTNHKRGNPGNPGNPGQSDQSDQSDQSKDVQELRADLAKLQAMVWSIAKNESIDTTMGYGLGTLSDQMKLAVDRLGEISAYVEPLRALGGQDVVLDEDQWSRLQNLIRGTKPLQLRGDDLPTLDYPTGYIGDAEPELPTQPARLEVYVRSTAS